MTIRRLPVYILADCSGSMAGEPIEAVKQGIRSLHSNLMHDPSAIESAYLSIITFGGGTQQLVPLTEVAGFTPPNLQAGGHTPLGSALQLLSECIEKEVQKTTADIKGDWKPLIFLLTDGEPTDDWNVPAEAIKKHKPGNLIAVGCGDANVEILKSITETVLLMRDMTPDSFNQFFKWVSQSIVQTSQKCGMEPDIASGGIHLPPPPPIITIVP